MQQVEAKQAQVETLLSRYEQTLNELEAKLQSQDEAALYSSALRERLWELASKTADMAASL